MNRRKINRLDVAIVILLLVVVGIFAYKQVGSRYNRYQEGGELPELEVMTYTYMVNNIRQMSVDGLKVGANLYDEDSKTLLGKVVSKHTEPFYDYIYSADGVYKKVPVPGKFTLYITVEGKVLETTDKYLAQGVYELKVHSRVKLATQLVGFEGELAYFDHLLTD